MALSLRTIRDESSERYWVIILSCGGGACVTRRNGSRSVGASRTKASPEAEGGWLGGRRIATRLVEIKDVVDAEEHGAGDQGLDMIPWLHSCPSHTQLASER